MFEHGDDQQRLDDNVRASEVPRGQSCDGMTSNHLLRCRAKGRLRLLSSRARRSSPDMLAEHGTLTGFSRLARRRTQYYYFSSRTIDADVHLNRDPSAK